MDWGAYCWPAEGEQITATGSSYTLSTNEQEQPVKRRPVGFAPQPDPPKIKPRIRLKVK